MKEAESVLALSKITAVMSDIEEAMLEINADKIKIEKVNGKTKMAVTVELSEVDE